MKNIHCNACEEDGEILPDSVHMVGSLNCRVKPTTPTNTPTSKCGKKPCCTIQYGEDAGICMADNCSKCHTPTTDSKNSSGKCEDPNHDIPFSELGGMSFHEYEAHEEKVFTSYTPDTTDTGWEKLRFTISELIEQIEDHGFARTEDIEGIVNVAQHIAKEEYERGVSDERERSGQIAHYWSIEVAPEISAQADINLDAETIQTFRTACAYLAGEIRAGKPAPYEKPLEAALETPQEEPEYIDQNPIKVRRETFKIVPNQPS